MAEATRPTEQHEGAPPALLVQVAGRAPHPLMVRAIAFVVGAASLGTEISAARLLAPYFGASTIIWANTIATVLVALSAGYWLGGKLADRRADLRGLCAVVLSPRCCWRSCRSWPTRSCDCRSTRWARCRSAASSGRWPRCWCWWRCR